MLLLMRPACAFSQVRQCVHSNQVMLCSSACLLVELTQPTVQSALHTNGDSDRWKQHSKERPGGYRQSDG